MSQIGPARKSRGTIPPGGDSVRPESQARKLRNVYACLVHESQECVVDLVRNLRRLDPDSTFLLYNGGQDGSLLQPRSCFD